MQTFSISQFKARCLAILERVRVTGEPIQIVRHGQPVAQVVPPPSAQAEPRRFLGRLEGQVEIVGDLLEPLVTARDFESRALATWPSSRRGRTAKARK